MNAAVSTLATLGPLGKAVFAYGLMALIAALCAVLIRAIVLVLVRSAPAAKPAAVQAYVSPIPPGDEGERVAAVIAAAVHAALGPQHILYIGDNPLGSAWQSEARARHHQSHRPQG